MNVSGFEYVIGSLFPRRPDGSLNLITAENLAYNPSSGVVSSTATPSAESESELSTRLGVSTDPVSIPGAERFLSGYYLPQLFATGAGEAEANSIFNQYFAGLSKQWLTKPRNQTMASLELIGYRGPGVDSAGTNDAYWNAVGSKDDFYFPLITDRQNFDPQALWANYSTSGFKAIEVSSTYDTAALLQNLDALNDPAGNPNPDFWYPTFLYTYSSLDEQGNALGTSYPGPVLMLQPGSQLKLGFDNRIGVPGLTLEQLQQSTLIRNSTFGNSASEGLGGTTSINYHLHGSHTNPGGFGDNVVARYTTGQEWTTDIDLPFDHGQGSYWYHPHYHPSVNQQVYGGLSGFMQLGDPLSKVPALRDTPRNLAVIKNMDLRVEEESGELRITSFDGSFGPGTVTNQATMVTVNGEFQPTATPEQGGWQALTLSNQTNQAFYNLSLIHHGTDAGGGGGQGNTLPLYIYGEDGHQYPQIRQATGTLGTFGSGAQTEYVQQQNLISLAPGKRVDVLVYLPEGRTELASTYSYKQTTATGQPGRFSTKNMGGYPDLSLANQFDSEDQDPFAAKQASSGPLAIFEVNAPVAGLTAAEQDAFITAANAGISVQEITPETRPEDYDPASVPSIDLFATDNDGETLWKPVRERMFNWAKGTLVGPAEERDPATQQALSAYEESSGQTYERYTALPVGGSGLPDWLGYENPFLINDHVFPNGNLTVAQLGTLEQWTLRNWSVNNAEKYIGHPFHIHINDYQTLDSDTELSDKRNLEDVTMVNASGFNYYNTKEQQHLVKEPLKGSFHAIPEAQDPHTVDGLATWGAADQTIRMLFQDYLGTYVFHCHILPHEDAGMMQAVMVVENTGSSWLVSADGLDARVEQRSGGDDQELTVHLAQNFEPFTLNLHTGRGVELRRGQAGDISSDFTQDLLISSAGDGQVRIIDGQTLLSEGRTELLAALQPYDTTLAPWAYAEDFSGDGQRDLITGGFAAAGGNGDVSLHDLRIKAFTSTTGGTSWHEEFAFDPYDFITHHSTAEHIGASGHGSHALEPVSNLSSDQVGFTVGDFNLDNFNDFALAYVVEGGLRVTLLDGAAFSLLYQTGRLEGGYFPDSTVLGDALIRDDSLTDLRSIDLTAGFNSYAQSAIENLLITTDSAQGRQQLTVQLDAGHFIATSEPPAPAAGGGHGGHGGGVMFPLDELVTNLPTQTESLPLHLARVDDLPDGEVASTATFSAALGNGALLLGDRLLVAQGNGFNGIDSSSDALIGSSQQLVMDLDGLRRVDEGDLAGLAAAGDSAGPLQRLEIIQDLITGVAQPGFSIDQTQERNNVAGLVSIAYAGSLPTPGTLAIRSAALATGVDAAGLVEEILADPAGQGQVESHFGGPLEGLSVDTIVAITYRTLFDREATAAESHLWQQAVQGGLDRTLLPLGILETTHGDDSFRVGLLSASSQWNALQWGHDGNVLGSFGQGFLPSEDRYFQLNALALGSGSVQSWEDAQEEFNAFSQASIDLLGGTPVSESGFF